MRKSATSCASKFATASEFGETSKRPNRSRMTDQFNGRDKLIAREAWAIEHEEARAVGQLTFLASTLVQCTLPHREPDHSLSYQRSNGLYTLTITAPPGVGIPWGRYPRLLLPWLTTEALRTRSRHIMLGRSLTSFMTDVGVTPAGGRKGTVDRFRDQAMRLFSATVMTHYDQPNEIRAVRYDIAREIRLWWQPNDPQQIPLVGSFVELTGDFYAAVLEHPVPLDRRVLRVLLAPLAIDLYAWLTFRMSYLRQTTTIPWPLLAFQFGSSYSMVKHFRAEVGRHLVTIIKLYPSLRIQAGRQGLILHPSPTHIRRLS